MNASIPIKLIPESDSERESRIRWATLAAADGCEASARELEELLEEGPEDLIPIRKLLDLSKGHRKFNREHRRPSK